MEAIYGVSSALFSNIRYLRLIVSFGFHLTALVTPRYCTRLDQVSQRSFVIVGQTSFMLCTVNSVEASSEHFIYVLVKYEQEDPDGYRT